MVIGTAIIFIIGTTVIAGSVHQMEDHMWCHLDIAVEVCPTLQVLSMEYSLDLGGDSKAAPKDQLLNLDYRGLD
jgi:hypothetical protein